MGWKILVVDDEKEVVESVSRRLIQEGYEVAAAFDGEEALAKIREAGPDIILLDLKIPKRNGFEVLKEVRENYKEKWIPVIIVSGRTDLESVKKSYHLEADHYLTKPCTMETILRGISTMISLIPLRES